MCAAARRIVIGIGNPARCDDAAGRAVARLLRRTLAEEIEVVEQAGEATALLFRIEGAAVAFLVDACASGASAGTVRRFDVVAAPLPRSVFRTSTHGFGLVEAIELARALGRLPPRCVVYAIEGESFAIGTRLSPAVKRAVADVARRLRAEIGSDVDLEGPARCTKPD